MIERRYNATIIKIQKKKKTTEGKKRGGKRGGRKEGGKRK